MTNTHYIGGMLTLYEGDSEIGVGVGGWNATDWRRATGFRITRYPQYDGIFRVSSDYYSINLRDDTGRDVNSAFTEHMLYDPLHEEYFTAHFMEIESINNPIRCIDEITGIEETNLATRNRWPTVAVTYAMKLNSTGNFRQMPLITRESTLRYGQHNIMCMVVLGNDTPEDAFPKSYLKFPKRTFTPVFRS